MYEERGRALNDGVSAYEGQKTEVHCSVRRGSEKVVDGLPKSRRPLERPASFAGVCPTPKFLDVNFSVKDFATAFATRLISCEAGFLDYHVTPPPNCDSYILMDAHAHLLSLGWAGPGHSLDSKPYKQKGHRGLAYDPAKVGNNGNGLVKPLSISQRQGRFGVGKKAHEPQAGNEWWLKGFESALGNIGKSESERSSGTSTPVVRDHSGKHGGLYSFFIRGQEMQGTIGAREDEKRSSKKRKSDALDEPGGDDQSGIAAQEAKRSASDFEQAGAYFTLRDKNERRRPRIQRASSVEEFEHVGKFLEERIEKPGKTKRNSEAVDSGTSTPLEPDQAGEDDAVRPETKEERRERRRKRREEKERKLAALEIKNHTSAINDSENEDSGARNSQKAERKRRKGDKENIVSRGS